MRRTKLFVLVAVFAANGWAQQPAAPPLEELLREGLARNPSGQALRLRLEEARALVAPAGSLPDPQVELQLQDVKFPALTVGKEEMSMVGVGVRQGFFYPGKRAVAREQAQSAVAVAEAELFVWQLEWARELGTLYARLYALDRELEALEASSALLQVLAEAAKTRYAAGLGEQEAAIKAELARANLAVRQANVRAQRQLAEAGLNRLLGRERFAPLGSVGSLPPLGTPPPPWPQTLLRQAARVRLAEARARAAAREVEVFRKALFPDFEAGAFLGSRGKFGAVASLSFGVQWPLFSREKQKPQLAAAELRYKAALAEVEAEKLALAENLAALEARMSQASAQSTRYEQEILPLATAALEAARASFLAGRGDFATVVEDFNLWLEAKVALASWQAEQFAAALDFACCLGILPWLSGQEVSHDE